MRAVRAKKILTQARKNGRTGKVDIYSEYHRLKKEHGKTTQHPKTRVSRRQQRLKAAGVVSRSYAANGRRAPKRSASRWRAVVGG